MPIHNYKCNTCNNIQEVITLRVSEEPTLICVECSGSDMVKQLGGGMHFKLMGEGWAEDGYQYSYTKSLAGTDDHVKPVYSRKKAQEALQKYKDNTFAPFKSEEIK